MDILGNNLYVLVGLVVAGVVVGLVLVNWFFDSILG